MQKRGSFVTASASMINVAAVFKYYALKRPLHYLNIDLGMGFISFNGHENYNQHSYDYTQINDQASFTIVIGLGYKIKIAEDFALTLTLREIINPGGIDYQTSGENYDVLVMPVCVGLRYLFQ